MKDMNDIHTVIDLELKQWFVKQCRDNYADYYLYYLPTTAEHNGGLLISENKPANTEYQLAERVRKDLTVDQNRYRLTEVARRLPILEA